MHTVFRNSFICILTLLAISSGFAQARAISETGGGLRITARIHDYVNLPLETLSQAKQEAGRIFQLEGIEVVWLNAPRNRTESGHGQASAHAAGEPATLYLTILPRFMAQRHPAYKKPYVFGVGVASRAQGFASVFFDRVEEIARRKDPSSLKPYPSLAGVLGHVMAHEIGHALGCGHSSRGLMGTQWTLSELTQIAQRELFFTPRQGKLLRTNVWERTKQTDISLR